MKLLKRAALCAGLTVGGGGVYAALPPPADEEAQTLILARAWVIDGTGAPAVPDGWIRVDGRVIREVGKGVPPRIEGARVLDLHGRTVLPGLSDMHVHLGRLQQARWFLKLMLAYGVTTVRDVGGDLSELAAIREWAKDAHPVPHLFFNGVIIDGSFEELRFLQSGRTLKELLEKQLAFGVDGLKVHNWLSSRAYSQVAEFSKAHDLPLAGHVPLSVTSVTAIERGMSTLEHVRLRPGEVLDDPEIVARYPLDLDVNQRDLFWGYLARTGEALRRTLDSWEARKTQFFLDPTLVVREAKARSDDPDYLRPPDLRYVSPATLAAWSKGNDPATGTPRRVFRDDEYALAKRAAAGQGTFVRLAHERGIRILTGTDTGVRWLIPGYALHEELQLLGRAGLSPIEVVRASTGRAAEALRVATRGTITPGQEADLVVVRGNVEGDLTALRHVELIVIDGEPHARSALLTEAERLAREDSVTLKGN